MLGKEEWDPSDVRRWSVDEVAYFFRRMGFKKFGYVDAIRKYRVDGKLLLTFEWEDYNNLGMIQSMHIKQTLLQLHRRPWYKMHVDHPDDIARRDRLRRHHNVDAAARLLQRKYRQRFARARIRMFHEIIRVQKAKDEAEAALQAGKNWWPQRVRDFSGLDPSLKVKHGKRRLTLGVRGWGQYVDNAWVAGPETMTDSHVSNWYTAKLNERYEHMNMLPLLFFLSLLSSSLSFSLSLSLSSSTSSSPNPHRRPAPQPPSPPSQAKPR